MTGLAAPWAGRRSGSSENDAEAHSFSIESLHER
jgi:hypothetical protein